MSRTIQQTENNDGSTMIAEVGTSTGFNAGDLVYYNNGDYKGAPSLTLPSTANFPLNASLPVTPNGFAKAIADPGVTSGGSFYKTSAVLTNGNIVQAFINYATNEPYFRIIDTSDVIQVAATLVSSTYLNASYPNIGVLALSGGGFVVYWTNTAGGTANRVNYAIYSNTGSVVTAATQDTTINVTIAYGAINGVALANGGFVLAAVTGTPALIFRGYDATGTALYAATTMSPAIANGYAWVGMSARSDSSFILIYGSSTTNVQYAIYSSVGVNLNTGSITVVANSGWTCDASTMSDGTTFVLAYRNQISSLATPCFRFLPISNALGSEFTVPPANINGSQMTTGTPNISVVGLSNGNFMMAFAENISNYQGMQYAVYDSSGVCVTGTNSSGAAPLSLNSVPMSGYSYCQLLDTTAGVMVHWEPLGRTGKIITSYYARISKTTYLPTAANTATINAGSASATASGIGYASTAPTAISVAAASSAAVNVPASTGYVVPPTALYTTNVVAGVGTATLPDGKFVIAYRDSVTYAVYASVFSSAGTLLQTVFVGTAYASSVTGGVCVCALTSGKFVVTYASGSGTGTNAMYSTSYALEATSTFTAAYSSNSSFSSDGLSDGRFVVVYGYSGNVTYSVYDSTNTLVVTANVTGTTGNGIATAASSWGGFFVSFYDSSAGNGKLFVLRPNSASTYVSITSTTVSSGGGIYNNNKGAFANGIYYFLTSYTGAGYVCGAYYTDVLASGTIGAEFIGADVRNYASVAIGVTGLGNPVLFYPNGTTNTNPLVGWNCKTVNNWATAQITKPSSPFFAGTGMSFRNGGFGLLPSLTPGAGNSVVAAWCDTNGYLYYAIINMHPANMTLTTVAGTTSSTPISVSPVAATSTASVIAGTFVGVAASTAAAGGTGQVIKNGPAKLNATYTNTASGAFDHSGTPTGGVKGTYSGSIVNMQGNT